MKKFLAVIISLAAMSLAAQDVYRLNDSTFVYPCITTDSTDWNMIGLPLQTNYVNASDFDTTGTNIEAVSFWDVNNQYYKTAVHCPYFGWIKDFPVQTGGAYFINAKNNFDFTVTGDSVNVVYNLINNVSNSDLNRIVLPLTKADLTTTELLAYDINYGVWSGPCNFISKWKANTQQFNNSPQSLSQWINVFNVYVGDPLILNIKDNRTWPGLKSANDENTNEGSSFTEKNTKAGNAKPRILFIHLVDDSGNELTDEEMKLIRFDTCITARPTDILNENSYDCGFMKINGVSVLYVNLASFISPWTAGEQLNVSDVNFDPGYGFDLSLDIDNTSSTIYYGFEDQIPGTGAPWSVGMDHIIPLTGVDVTVREESGNIVLEWGTAGEDVTGYNIYSSDDPYGTFSYIDTTVNISWSTAASENRKFFYVVSTNAKSLAPPKTIEVKEKISIKQDY
jgi:hypothetical protein